MFQMNDLNFFLITFLICFPVDWLDIANNQFSDKFNNGGGLLSSVLLF